MVVTITVIIFILVAIIVVIIIKSYVTTLFAIKTSSINGKTFPLKQVRQFWRLPTNEHTKF